MFEFMERMDEERIAIRVLTAEANGCPIRER